MKGVTPYQFEALLKVREIEAASGRLADFDQVLEKLSWTPSKESAQFTIRAIIAKGFMEKMPVETRRGRNRVLYRVTEKGKRALDPRVPMPELTEKEGMKLDEMFLPGVPDVLEPLEL